eukprot:PhM_4_TR9300/c0_g1_i1/m.24450
MSAANVVLSRQEYNALRTIEGKYHDLLNDIAPTAATLCETSILMHMDAVEYSGDIAVRSPLPMENVTLRFDRAAKEVQLRSVVAGKPVVCRCLRFNEVRRVSSEPATTLTFHMMDERQTQYQLTVGNADRYHSLVNYCRHVFSEFHSVIREEFEAGCGLYALRHEHNFPYEPMTLRVDNTTSQDVEVTCQLLMHNLEAMPIDGTEVLSETEPALVRRIVPKRSVVGIARFAEVDPGVSCSVGYEFTWQALPSSVIEGLDVSEQVPPGVAWRRVGGLPLFASTSPAIHINDISVGSEPTMGCVFSLLAERPNQLVKALDLEVTRTSSGTTEYTMWLSDAGWWRSITVDDLVPSLPSYFGTCTSGSSFDVVLKALACMCGGYLEAVAQPDAMQRVLATLTGFPVRHVPLRPTPLEGEQPWWVQLDDGCAQKHWVAAVPRRDTAVTKHAYNARHMYAILGVKKNVVTLRDSRHREAVHLPLDQFAATFDHLVVCAAPNLEMGMKEETSVRVRVPLLRTDASTWDARYYLRLDLASPLYKTRITACAQQTSGFVGVVVLRRGQPGQPDELVAWSGFRENEMAEITMECLCPTDSLPFFIVPVWFPVGGTHPDDAPTATSVVIGVHSIDPYDGHMTAVQATQPGAQSAPTRVCLTRICLELGREDVVAEKGLSNFSLCYGQWFALVAVNTNSASGGADVRYQFEADVPQSSSSSSSCLYGSGGVRCDTDSPSVVRVRHISEGHAHLVANVLRSCRGHQSSSGGGEVAFTTSWKWLPKTVSAPALSNVVSARDEPPSTSNFFVDPEIVSVVQSTLPSVRQRAMRSLPSLCTRVARVRFVGSQQQQVRDTSYRSNSIIYGDDDYDNCNGTCTASDGTDCAYVVYQFHTDTYKTNTGEIL